ncbi:MAG: redox-regulated ATPase YchF [Bryobacteraceae bacterium]|nr:redox-regulated ATPase YchF [Bryobacteraceae bacterium]
MKTAIVGLPMTGKTSLFTILTGVRELTHIGSTEARIGITKVPDPRLEALAKIYEPPKVTHATVEFFDFPSISKEALRDPGYLGSLRVADAIAHVVRVFEDDTVPHEKGSVDPLRDIEDVDVELILSDLVVVEKRLERLEKDRKKAHGAELEQEFDLLTEAKQRLEANETLRGWDLSKEADKMMRGFQFLSQKPMLIVLNLGEADAPRLADVEAEYAAKLRSAKPGIGVTAICAKIEAELAELSPEERAEYMASYGLPGSSLDRMVGAAYRLLGLMSFLTAGEDECRAWTIPIGSNAVKAAGAIHSDFEKKFIRAEAVNWKIVVDNGGYSGLREKGQLRLEGKDYIVQDGDILEIRHG